MASPSEVSAYGIWLHDTYISTACARPRVVVCSCLVYFFQETFEIFQYSQSL